jgi:hypothetical protein
MDRASSLTWSHGDDAFILGGIADEEKSPNCQATDRRVPHEMGYVSCDNAIRADCPDLGVTVRLEPKSVLVVAHLHSFKLRD